MNRRDADDEYDVARLLGELQEPVQPSASFRAALMEELQRHLAPRRGEGEPPEGWALCPFEVFSIAEQRLPWVVRANCPFLWAAPLLGALKDRGLPMHARPCPGLPLFLEARRTMER